MPDRITVEKAFGKLYDIVKRLREPGGCPWYQEQSAYSLRTNLVEEAYECVSAIEEADQQSRQPITPGNGGGEHRQQKWK